MIGKKLQKALGLAVEELKRRRHEYLTLEHVLYGIASEPSGRKLIERCGGSAPVLRQALDHFFKTYMESLDEPTKDVYQTLAVQRVLDSALAHVKSAGRDEDIGVEVGDVLAAILEEEEYSWAAYCLKKQGITRLPCWRASPTTTKRGRTNLPRNRERAKAVPNRSRTPWPVTPWT